MMLLSAARTRIRNLVDDNRGGSSPKWADSEVTAALTAAQGEIASLLSSNGSRAFRLTGSVSSNAAGVADLTTLAPVNVLSVAMTIGTERYLLPRGGGGGVRAPRPGVEALTVVYDGVPAFPAGDGLPFTWGAAAANAILDSLLVYTAAAELKVKEGEVNTMLEKKRQELQVQALEQIPARWTPLVSSRRGYPQGLGWIYGDTANTIQLAYL